MALNHVSIMGRLTSDIEVKSTPSGVSVTQFTLAVESDFKGADGNKQTYWIDCCAWRNTAEFLGKFMSKGRMIVVSGKLQTRTWQDKDGKNRKAVEVIADNVYFADSKQKESGNASGGFNTSSSFNTNEFEEVSEDFELPF